MAIALVGCCGLAFAQSQTPSSDGTKKKGFVGDISDLTERNSDFRRVLYTGKNMQLVLMSLKPGEDIGEEVHDDVDQFFRIEEGNGEVSINGQTASVKSDDAILVPAGARHNVKNTGTAPLRLYTIYAPPEHKDKTIHATKQDATSKEAHFDGKTSESSD
jgi:mannose-6-phosphate isomerase-like protein (cupin superfamily)